jgi:molybdate transport system substrate-binding protein
MKKSLLISLAFLLPATLSGQIKVAVAANLQSVIKILALNCKTKTGVDIQTVSGSSGNLVTQIKNGAPFDVFLSADMSFPEALYADGLTIAKPEVYALGSLIVCSTENFDTKHWQSLVLHHDEKKIAIANPLIAPYGKAAKEALVKLNLYDKISAGLITGESIAQVNTYIFNNVVYLGFTTQSFIYDSGQSKKLYWVAVDPKLYSPLQQGMVILKHAQLNNLNQAQRFYKYMLSSSAKAILKKNGYHVL